MSSCGGFTGNDGNMGDSALAGSGVVSLVMAKPIAAPFASRGVARTAGVCGLASDEEGPERWNTKPAKFSWSLSGSMSASRPSS